MKQLLIIGSKGFIGKHCLDYFRKQEGIIAYGCDVVVDYVEEKYFLIDASNCDFEKIFRSNQFDVCINCSGAASVSDSIKNPRRDYELNTVNVFKMLDAIRRYNQECKFINLSSAAVYGNPVSLPIYEHHGVAPMSPYGYHKWKSEIINKEMHQLFGLKTCSLRIFSAYGEGLHKQLFWDLYQKAKRGPVELFGSGEESRDFIHVADIVQIIDLVIRKLDFTGNIVNVGNGKEIFIKDAVKVFYDLLDKSIVYKFRGEKRKGDPSNWVADITQLKNIGYQQKNIFTEGMKKYVAWLRGLE